ncbi:MAG: LUD domain-containing protein [Methanobacteriota archaeon]|nr:MAG: LUD domain-containing protein [Euryarchaeota archaeon]
MQIREEVRKAVRERDSLDGMRRAFETIVERRKANAERFHDLQSAKDRLRELKEFSVGNDELLALAVSSLRENGCRVILAETRNSAIDLIAREVEGLSLVVKSKSNLTKELHITEALSERGVEVVETDLGDRIIQLQGGPSVHPTGPACHLTREQISALLSEHFGRPVSDDPKELTKAVKEEISGYLNRAQAGITGANAIAAREGAIVIVHNEGNAARCASVPGRHIVVTSSEKIVPSLRDAVDVASLQIFYSTGKLASAYIDVISGPSYTADIEKKIFRGMHGPEEVIVVIVDDGRRTVADREPLFCIGCGSCLTHCPVYSVVGPLFGTPGHPGGQGLSLLSSMDRLREAKDAGLYLCTSCGECKVVCPAAIDTRKSILKGRQACIDQKLEYSSEHGTVVASVRNYDNPWQMPRARRARWSSALRLPSRGEVIYFAGCSTSFLFPDIARNTVSLLRSIGVEPVYLGHSEKCCGSTVRKLGDVELARAKAESCFRDFAEAGAKVVVTSCPGCYSTLDSYDDLKRNSGLRVQHISQYMADHMDRLRISPVDDYGRVTYHDPCDLGREKGVFDEPRRLIEAALSSSAIEMDRFGSESACCGAGSGVKSSFDELALAMAQERVRHAESVGAETIVTACPWCVKNLRDCQGTNPSVSVVDLTELLLSSIAKER